MKSRTKYAHCKRVNCTGLDTISEVDYLPIECVLSDRGRELTSLDGGCGEGSFWRVAQFGQENSVTANTKQYAKDFDNTFQTNTEFTVTIPL